jgi:hypothetical protein
VTPSPAHLRVVVDRENGIVHQGCPRCEDVNVEDVTNLERENRRLMRKVREMERDREAERQQDPERQTILSLIERWKLKTGHPKSNANAGDRFDAVKARLREGYTVEQLELAIDGIGAFPYVVNGQRLPEGKRSQRHDRLGIVLKGGEDVERFAVLGHHARKGAAHPDST